MSSPLSRPTFPPVSSFRSQLASPPHVVPQDIVDVGGGSGAVTYQGSGIGAIETEQGDGRLNVFVGSGGGIEAHLRGNCPRGSCSASGAEQYLSRQHDGCRRGS